MKLLISSVKLERLVEAVHQHRPHTETTFASRDRVAKHVRITENLIRGPDFIQAIIYIFDTCNLYQILHLCSPNEASLWPSNWEMGTPQPQNPSTSPIRLNVATVENAGQCERLE